MANKEGAPRQNTIGLGDVLVGILGGVLALGSADLFGFAVIPTVGLGIGLGIAGSKFGRTVGAYIREKGPFD